MAAIHENPVPTVEKRERRWGLLPAGRERTVLARARANSPPCFRLST